MHQRKPQLMVGTDWVKTQPLNHPFSQLSKSRFEPLTANMEGEKPVRQMPLGYSCVCYERVQLIDLA